MNEIDFGENDDTEQLINSNLKVDEGIRNTERVYNSSLNPLEKAAITSSETSTDTEINNTPIDLMNAEITNTDPTSNAKIEDEKKLRVDENVDENATTTKNKPLCFKIHYNFEKPEDSIIELCESIKQGGKTQKKKRSLKPLKRKTIHKKLKFRKTPKKKHPRRRSIRK